jgi:O-acetyl-ADP-ribose deacetylase (regulator of RNase III)
VIHAVGPVWQGGAHNEDALLASCYARAIELAAAHGCRSIAFPAISTGAYRFPADRAAGIAVAATLEALAAHPSVERVVFACFGAASAAAHRRALEAHGS